MRTRYALLIVVATVAGVAGCVVFGNEFWQHANGLAHYVKNEEWKQWRPSDYALQEQIQYRYADAQTYVVHSPGGALSLRAPYAAETVSMLANSLPHETYGLRLRHEVLPDEYRSLLQAATASVMATYPEPSDIPQWLRNASRYLRRDSHDKKALDLSASPGNSKLQIESHLARAIAKFSDGTLPSTTASGVYRVGTTPDALRLDDSTHEYRSRVRSSRSASMHCTSTVSAIEGTSPTFSADVHVYPRFLHMEMNRSWIDDAFLNHRYLLNEEINDRYFGSRGTLRILPKYLVISAPSFVTIIPSPESMKVLSGLVASNSCCKITCGNGLQVRLDPHRSRNVPRGAVGYDLTAPDVSAVVSLRREGQ